jgi:outer membrane protein
VSPVFFDNVSLRLSVQQPLFTGFRLQAGREAALFQQRSAGEDKDQDRADFMLSVKSAYWGLVRARRVTAVVDENLAQIDSHLKDVRALFAQGLVTKSEVLRVEVQRANAEVMRLEAESSIDVALTRLVSLIGLPRGTDIEPTTPPESVASAAFSATETASGAAEDELVIIESALASRPDLKSADFRIGAAEAGVKAARAGWYPQVYFSGNYSYLRPNPRLMPAQGKFYGSWDLSVSLSLDVWNWRRTKHQSDQAEARLAQARDARKLLEDQAVLEITQGRLGVVKAGKRVRVSAGAVGLAEENLRTTRDRFRQGMALNSDVLDAEVALLQARLNRTRAAIDFALAEARLEKAMGR